LERCSCRACQLPRAGFQPALGRRRVAVLRGAAGRPVGRTSPRWGQHGSTSSATAGRTSRRVRHDSPARTSTSAATPMSTYGRNDTTCANAVTRSMRRRSGNVSSRPHDESNLPPADVHPTAPRRVRRRRPSRSAELGIRRRTHAESVARAHCGSGKGRSLRSVQVPLRRHGAVDRLLGGLSDLPGNVSRSSAIGSFPSTAACSGCAPAASSTGWHSPYRTQLSVGPPCESLKVVQII
jgi:hypothetical protein